MEYMTITMLIFTTLMISIYLKIMLSSLLMEKSFKNWKSMPTKMKSFTFSKFNIISLLTLPLMTITFNLA